MRFIHTADWHLGRLFYGTHLTEDQEFTLEGLLRLAEREQADAVIIAGDVFDRAVPPPEAVRLLDRTVARLALDLKVAVVMIAGNHDSAARLEYMSELARRTGVHVVGRVGREARPAEIMGRDGTGVRFWPLAYTEPEIARGELERDDIHSHEQVLAAQIETIARGVDGGARDVVVGHAFVAGCEPCESERELTVGGSAAVSAALFDGFDYVALGHLHGCQGAGSERIRYSGSLLKYSFSETGHQKSVTVVDLGTSGDVSVREATLPIKRDVCRLRGAFAELLAGEPGELSEAYVEVVLTDSEPILNPVDRLRKKFPFLRSLRREETEREMGGPASGSSGVKTRSTADLFADFFEDVSGDPVSEPQAAEVATVLDALGRADREAGAGGDWASPRGPESGFGSPAGREDAVGAEAPAVRSAAAGGEEPR